jgi:hypothetical protein
MERWISTCRLAVSVMRFVLPLYCERFTPMLISV